MKKLMTMVAIATMCCATQAFGQQPEIVAGGVEPAVPVTSTYDPSVPTVAPIRKGEAAPFDGNVLNAAAIAKITTELRYIDETVAIEVESTQKVERAKCKLATDQLTAALEAEKTLRSTQVKLREQQIREYQEALEESAKPRHGLWFSIGAGSGVLTTVGIVLMIVLL